MALTADPERIRFVRMPLAPTRADRAEEFHR
jgi:hypothetical protein